MICNFYFKKMYEPGEYAPPIFEMEAESAMVIECKPSYRDNIKFENRHYTVRDFWFDLDRGRYECIAVRPVGRGEISNGGREL